MFLAVPFMPLPPMLGVLDFEAFGAVGLALVTGPDPDLEAGFLAIVFVLEKVCYATDKQACPWETRVSTRGEEKCEVRHLGGGIAEFLGEFQLVAKVSSVARLIVLRRSTEGPSPSMRIWATALPLSSTKIMSLG